jgi:hypothetical protein
MGHPSPRFALEMEPSSIVQILSVILYLVTQVTLYPEHIKRILAVHPSVQ